MSPDSYSLWAVATCDTKRRDAIVELEKLICPHDRGEAAHFRREGESHQFLMSRALVRLALSERAAVAPVDWRFARYENSRPFVSAPELDARPWFSISHTDGFIACLTSLTQEAAVDVEKIEPDCSLAQVAEEVFSPEEQEALHASSGSSEWTRRFFRYWTLKEAYAKARGLGLNMRLSDVSFHWGDDGGIEARFAPAVADNPDAWRFWNCDLDADYTISIAARVESHLPCELRVRSRGGDAPQLHSLKHRSWLEPGFPGCRLAQH